jgi:hypothetical protein
MIRTQAQTPLPFLRKMDARVARIPGVFTTAWQRQQGRIRSYAKRVLRVKPGKPKYPIKWKSERQRRAFFATDGFGRGIPTKRTDVMIDAWDVKFKATTTGGQLTLINDTPYAEFVVGDDQQPFHKESGWYQVEDKVQQINTFAADTLESVWVTSTDIFAGIPQR